MGALEAVSIATNLITAGLELVIKAQQISALVQKAQAEGRDLTPAEMEQARKLDDDARGRLAAAIAAHGG